MSALFQTVLRMSLLGAATVVFVLLVRLLLRRAPKKWSYLAWLPVLFRLVCPVGPRAAFSLFGLFARKTTAPGDGWTVFRAAELFNAFEAVPQTSVPAETAAPYEAVPARHAFDWMKLIAFFWLVGILTLAVISIVKTVELTKKLRGARMTGGVYESAKVVSPFVFGIFRPRVYLPAGLDAETKGIIIAHENSHIRRGDHIVKLIAFAVLSVHWFDPFVWLAFLLMTRDMEMSCDESIIARDPKLKKQYGKALLRFAETRESGFPSPCPVSFGETCVKARIKNVLGYRKPKKLVCVIAVLLIIAAATVCITDPVVKAAAGPEDTPQILPTQLPVPAATTSPEPTVSPEPGEPAAVFSDPLVEKAVLAQLGRESGPVYGSELLRISGLALCEGRFDDLSDLDKLPNLFSLFMVETEISDTASLARLSNLRRLVAWDCSFSDISFLAKTTKLTVLRLVHCGLTDVSPLAGLSALDVLDLTGNRITDLSPLMGLGGLAQLTISWNPFPIGQAEALDAALGCTVRHSSAADVNAMLWPLDIDGDGKDEYAAIDRKELAAGSTCAVLLDDDMSYIASLSSVGVTQNGERVSIAAVHDEPFGDCILICFMDRENALPTYNLLHVSGGMLCSVEHQSGETDRDRLLALYRKSSIIVCTDERISESLSSSAND